MTSFYDRHIMPRLIGCACASNPIMRQRAKIVPLATGRVLELGIGGGLNLAFYDPTKVSEVNGVDPSHALRDRAAAADRPAGLKVTVQPGVAEALPFDNGTFDTGVCTYTLCSVRSSAATLSEAFRTLKPGGRFLFCEHGLAPDAGVARWQRRIEPMWRKIAGDCHLTRAVAPTITGGGFEIEHLDTMYLPNTPKIAGWQEWGAAVKR